MAGSNAHEAGGVEQMARLLAELGYIHRHWRVSPDAQAAGEQAVWDEHWSLTVLLERLCRAHSSRRSWTNCPLPIHAWGRLRRSDRQVEAERRPLDRIDAPSLDCGLDVRDTRTPAG
jgi:hypothetical protein